MSGSRRAAAAAHLFELLAGPGGPGQRGYGVANAGRADAGLAAIVAGGWSDAGRVGQRAAELLGQALGTQGAAPPAVVCAGGTLEPTPAERAAALEEYTEYSGGPLPDPRPPHAEQLKAVLMQEHAGLELRETPSATVATQASDAAALLGDRASDGATVVVVASPYQQTGLRLELAAAAPTARVICALSGGYAEESAWWESQGRVLHALMLAEAGRLEQSQTVDREGERLLLAEIATAAADLEASLEAEARSIASGIADRGVKVVCCTLPNPTSCCLFPLLFLLACCRSDSCLGWCTWRQGTWTEPSWPCTPAAA